MINKLLNFVDSIYWSANYRFCTLIMKCSTLAKNIALGSNCKFFGLMKFKKSNKSIIVVGDNCVFRSSPTSNLIGINRPCIISTHSEESILVIGKNCGFSGTVIGCFKEITIGDNVRFGANSLVTDGDWHTEDKRTNKPKSIIIEDNAWIGVGTMVLKGVRIGKNSIIGAGSVVVNDIPSNVIAVGNPCREVKIIS